jgi:hypothetical protein
MTQNNTKPEHNIPPGIDPRWIWCAKDADGEVVLFASRPFYDDVVWEANDGSWEAIVCDPTLANFLPEDSLHERRAVDGKVTDEWDHVQMNEDE